MMNIKKIILAGLFIAFGIVLPIAFHFVNFTGVVFLPMHIPVLIAGLMLGSRLGLMVGIITPVLSSLLTGMPPMAPVPIAIIMIFELAVYGGTIGYLREKKVNVFIALLSAQVLGRIMAGVVVAVLVFAFGFHQLSPITYVTGSIVTGIPGIIIQLLLIPSLYILLTKLNLIKRSNL